MNRFFHSEYGAARSYLFAKLFLITLALDTWVLMIGHAGRYGMTGFNVAHFEWLDHIQPVPSAAFYIGVLILVGLLALTLALTGLHRVAVFVLFVLYTFSWSMSMLDSYQHHYFVSLALLCLVFFPETSAAEIHPFAQSAAASPAETTKRAARTTGGRHAGTAGFIYAGAIATMTIGYLATDHEGHAFSAFLVFAGAVAIATALYRPERMAPPHTNYGWGYSLLGASVAILYFYTAVAKAEERWVAGDTILRISEAKEVFGWLADAAVNAGIERDAFWSFFATAVIPQELFLSAAYLVAVHQDRLRHWLVRAICLLGFGAAILLHVGAEAMELEIGWFSYYMLALAVTFLAPLEVVDRLATVFTWPARTIERAMREWDQSEDEPVAVPLLLAAGGAVLVGAIGKLIDLPGAFGGCVLFGVALFALSAWRLSRGDRAGPKRWSAGALLAALGMWLAIAASPVRFDFYRYLGGDLSRRGQPEAALSAYVRGERYAPQGESRAKKIEKLKRQLGHK